MHRGRGQQNPQAVRVRIPQTRFQRLVEWTNNIKNGICRKYKRSKRFLSFSWELHTCQKLSKTQFPSTPSEILGNMAGNDNLSHPLFHGHSQPSAASSHMILVFATLFTPDREIVIPIRRLNAPPAARLQPIQQVEVVDDDNDDEDEEDDKKKKHDWESHR